MKQVSVKFQEFWSDPPSAQLHTTFIFYTSVYSETSVCTQTASSSTFILTFFRTSVLVFLLGVLYLREYSSHLRLQEGHTVLFQPAHQPSVGSWEQGFLLHIKLFWFFFFHFWKKKTSLSLRSKSIDFYEHTAILDLRIIIIKMISIDLKDEQRGSVWNGPFPPTNSLQLWTFLSYRKKKKKVLWVTVSVPPHMAQDTPERQRWEES